VKGLATKYQPGVRGWAKDNIGNTVEVIVGAVVGTPERAERLVLGKYDDGSLRIVGSDGPLTPAQRRVLRTSSAPSSAAGRPRSQQGGSVIGAARFNSCTWSSRHWRSKCQLTRHSIMLAGGMWFATSDREQTPRRTASLVLSPSTLPPRGTEALSGQHSAAIDARGTPLAPRLAVETTAGLSLPDAANAMPTARECVTACSPRR
jgi:hypothetical protein